MLPQDAYSGVQPTKFSEHTSKVIQKVCGECIVGTISCEPLKCPHVVAFPCSRWHRVLCFFASFGQQTEVFVT